MSNNLLGNLRDEARACRHCAALIPHEPNPVFMLAQETKLCLISQAPGKLAHDSGIAWNDPSGDRLRHWLGLSRAQFFDSNAVSVVPMSFCFPGYKNNADAPPLKPCAPMWHPRFLAAMKPALILVIGRYAQQHYLPQYQTLTRAIQATRTPASINAPNLVGNVCALPHPSGRNNRWLARHTWFESEHVPVLQAKVRSLF
ncbi:uracil-DNA glycosylase family protein [Alteromonas oceanisediminis]|uniref:uracil-DNA glycosylase family protein n=1 Tax=Alteromonas oceanisediminis TaxID=2836180 RepID=UPI001BDA971D|nr:uracil-DNA glycosylase family protein [Alteromonas oceanisediminis]MBT0587832.1 uracil-DNA glycosylase family protein [Alteromonas oceanisediminis]